jgi:hypothetical protein
MGYIAASVLSLQETPDDDDTQGDDVDGHIVGPLSSPSIACATSVVGCG